MGKQADVSNAGKNTFLVFHKKRNTNILTTGGHQILPCFTWPAVPMHNKETSLVVINRFSPFLQVFFQFGRMKLTGGDDQSECLPR